MTKQKNDTEVPTAAINALMNFMVGALVKFGERPEHTESTLSKSLDLLAQIVD